MQRISAIQYLIIVLGITSLVWIGMTFSGATWAAIVALSGVVAVFAFLYRVAEIGSNSFAIDRRSGQIFGPRARVFQTHGNTVFSQAECAFEFSPDGNEERVLQVEYRVPDAQKFGLVSVLADRGISLAQYIQDQLALITCDLSEWDHSQLEECLTQFKDELHGANVEFSVRMQQRLAIAEA